jgi:NAD(P)-dependent dehydrogenase (short-subunit alcohol dehydrogenase family)
MNMADKMIFITGVSSGLGLALEQEALTQRWQAVGTVRNEEARKSFEAKPPGHAEFGIFVTAVAPGMFRTDWAGGSLRHAPRTISDYDQVFEPRREARRERSGKQTGDPVKAAKAMLKILADLNPPAHLLLGPDAVKMVIEKLDALKAEIEAYRELSTSTDFDPA